MPLFLLERQDCDAKKSGKDLPADNAQDCDIGRERRTLFGIDQSDDIDGRYPHDLF